MGFMAKAKNFGFIPRPNILEFFILLQTHLPGYVEKAAELKAKGVEVIACIAVNDPFVMEAWGKAHNADGKARFCYFY